MEKLFDETVGITKIRPTKITKQQRKDLFLKLADEIIENQYSKSDRDTIANDLAELSDYDTGFEKAKALEQDGIGNYTFEGDFIDFLEGIGDEKYWVLQENVKLWVKAHNPNPKFDVGQKLIIEVDLNREQRAGGVIYINGIKDETATYIIDKDPNKGGGFIIAYELVESNCKITI
jgi:hypothetical protein